MGQYDVGELLKKHYPKYLSYKEITKLLDISDRNVWKSLAKLSERNEVEVMTKESKTLNGRWIKSYRIKPEEKEWQKMKKNKHLQS